MPSESTTRVLFVLFGGLALTACGGGGGDSGGGGAPPAPPPSFSVGGNVSGLVGSVVLQNNGGGDLTVAANGAFTFASSIPSGGGYNVTVRTQPELQTCSVTNGAGTVSAAVTGVAVNCADIASPVLDLQLSAVKTFSLSWPAVPGATRYRIFEDPTGGGAFAQMGSDVEAGTTSVALGLTVQKPLHLRAHARFTVRACGATRCLESAPVQVGMNLVDAIGYIKAAHPGADDGFGRTLALSADGSTLAVGTIDEDGNAIGVDGDDQNDLAVNSGAVFIFGRSAATGAWVQQAYIKASRRTFLFSSGLSLSADGNVLAVGAYGDSAGVIQNVGAVFVFERSASGGWSERDNFTGINSEDGDTFGSRVRLSGDGTLLAVSALGEDSAATGINGNLADNSASAAGAVYVYRRTNAGTWAFSAYLKPQITSLSLLFGRALAISGDGQTLAVGTSSEDTNLNGNAGGAPNSGAVWIFSRSGSNWAQQAFLKASNAQTGDAFGTAVSLSDDGSTLVVGALQEGSAATGINGNQSDNSATNAGAGYVFTRSGTTWSQQAYLKASNTHATDFFGGSVAVSGDGNIIAVGATGEDSQLRGVDVDQSDDAFSAAGAVYVFERNGGSWLQRAYVKASNTGAFDEFGAAVALSVDGATLAVSAPGEDSWSAASPMDNSYTNAGAVYLY